MSQIDNRNSSAVKRARTDGGRREDDWTCPSCANVNFSFRTTCNMRNCTQPRPADHNSKPAPRQTPTPQGYSSSSPYAGSGAPSSMYVGAPPYNSNLFNGTSVPPYDVPLSSGSAYHYNYNNRLPGGNLYRPLQFANTLPYSGGPMIGSGGLYGLPQLMEQFGLRLPLGQAAMGPRPGFFPEETSQKKDGTRENDWECPKCGNVNFSFRTVCNMRKCNTPKPGSQTAKPAKSSKTDMPEGSWKCDQCNNINYPFRTKCNRQNCGAEKPLESEISPKEEEENEQVRINQSGCNDLQIFERAVLDYEKHYKKPFTHVKAWHILRNQPKWLEQPVVGQESEGSSKKRKSSHSSNVPTPTNEVPTPTNEDDFECRLPSLNDSPASSHQSKSKKNASVEASDRSSVRDTLSTYTTNKISLLKAQLEAQRKKNEEYFKFVEGEVYNRDMKFVMEPHDNILDPTFKEFVINIKRELCAKHGWPCSL